MPPPPVPRLGEGRLRVLLCDPEPERRRLLAEQIDGLGEYLLVPCERFDDLLPILELQSPDVVLVAARPQHGDAAALCRQLKDRPDGGPPVIMIIDAGDGGAIEVGHQAGVDEFLSRPVGVQELSARLRRVTGLQYLLRHSASGAARGASGRQKPPAAEGEGYRVMLVEENGAHRASNALVLGQQGYQVSLASDGRAALAMAERDRPDLILLDVILPELNGYEVCLRLKARAETQRIPVILVTSSGSPRGAREGFLAGADDYLGKPVNAAELRVRIRTMLRIQELRTPLPEADPGDSHGSSGVAAPEYPEDLQELFDWCELSRKPAIRELKRLVTVETARFLEGIHKYRPEIFSDPETPEDLLHVAYAEMRLMIKRNIETFLRLQSRRELNLRQQELMISDEVNDRFAMGPIQPLLDDPRISDILVNRYNEIHIEIHGRLIATPVTFRDEDHIRRIASVMLRYSGKEVNEARPYVEARLRDGSRIGVTLPPLSIDGTTITVRKFVITRMGLEDMLRESTLSAEMARLLDLFVRAGLNIIVSGATGAGKTTLLNLLGSSIPLRERIITVEDTAELQLRHRDVIPELMGRQSAANDQPAKNMERYEARSSHIEGLDISIRDIIRLALRKRPDRIIVGEVRGPEALDMLNAMNTGHRGCLSTIHSNNTMDMIVRLENMVLEANSALPLSAAQRLIVAGLNIAVQIVKFADNRRRITEITEIESYDSALGQIRLRPLFEYRPGAPDPYVFVSVPSVKVHKLIEEYLMKSGSHRRRWDEPLGREGARDVLKGIFRRHLEVHFQSWMMSGKDASSKRQAYAEAMDWLATEVFNPENVVHLHDGPDPAAAKDAVGRDVASPGEGGIEDAATGDADAGTARAGTVAVASDPPIPYCDVVDNAFLVQLHAEARLKLASRLNLPVELLGPLVRRETLTREAWTRLFPPTPSAARNAVRRPNVPLSADPSAETAPPPIQEEAPGPRGEIAASAPAVAEGLELDDLRFAFYGCMSFQAGMIRRLRAEGEGAVLDKITSLQPLVPYLVL